MPEDSASTLRVDPAVLARLITTYEQAANRMTALLTDVRNRGRLPGPWTEDPISKAMADHYHEQIFGFDGTGESPYCTFGALRSYRDGLVNVRATLERIKADYERAEGESAGSFDRL